MRMRTVHIVYSRVRNRLDDTGLLSKRQQFLVLHIAQEAGLLHLGQHLKLLNP